MAGTKHTAGPWSWAHDNEPYSDQWTLSPGVLMVDGSDGTPGGDEIDRANARLIAAAPSMADAIKGLIGLCQLLRNRDDCPSEIRQALTHNHRIIAGYEALSAAGIDGFQPSDFDRSKAEGSSHA